MRFAFIRSWTIWPAIFEPRRKVGALAAHLLTNTRTLHQGQVGRQVRRAAAGFNKALDYALALAERLHASIVLLHVVNRIYAEGFLDTPAKRDLRTEAHRLARKKLDGLVERKSNYLASIRCVVCGGVPEYEILRLAESMDVDLIVLGRQPRSSLSRLLFGSVARDVVDLAPCPSS